MNYSLHLTARSPQFNSLVIPCSMLQLIPDSSEPFTSFLRIGPFQLAAESCINPIQKRTGALVLSVRLWNKKKHHTQTLKTEQHFTNMVGKLTGESPARLLLLKKFFSSEIKYSRNTGKKISLFTTTKWERNTVQRMVRTKYNLILLNLTLWRVIYI